MTDNKTRPVTPTSDNKTREVKWYYPLKGEYPEIGEKVIVDFHDSGYETECTFESIGRFDNGRGTVITNPTKWRRK